jgi:hypothetical protein
MWSWLRTLIRSTRDKVRQQSGLALGGEGRPSAGATSNSAPPYDTVTQVGGAQSQELTLLVKALQEQVGELILQQKALEAKVTQEATSGSESAGDKFMLAEFNELGDLWRHTDQRLDKGLAIYLTTTTIAVSVLAIVARQDASQWLPQDIRWILTIALSLLLAINGVVYARLIVESQRTKTEYRFAAMRIRRYFVGQDENLRAYTILRIDDSVDLDRASFEKHPQELTGYKKELREALDKSVKVKIPMALLFGVYTITGVSLGVGVTATIVLAKDWLRSTMTFTKDWRFFFRVDWDALHLLIPTHVVLGVLSGLAICLVLFLLGRRTMRRQSNELRERAKESAKGASSIP